MMDEMEHVFLRQTYDWGFTHEFGILRDYTCLIGCYFTNANANESIKIYNIQYQPDAIYVEHDGYAGTCWEAYVEDQNTKEKRIYHFRNFCDMDSVYRAAGYKFQLGISPLKSSSACRNPDM